MITRVCILNKLCVCERDIKRIIVSFALQWSDDEVKALVNYILCRGYVNKWQPFTADPQFWETAADFVYKTAAAEPSAKRTGEN